MSVDYSLHIHPHTHTPTDMSILPIQNGTHNLNGQQRLDSIHSQRNSHLSALIDFKYSHEHSKLWV